MYNVLGDRNTFSTLLEDKYDKTSFRNGVLSIVALLPPKGGVLVANTAPCSFEISSILMFCPLQLLVTKFVFAIFLHGERFEKSIYWSSRHFLQKLSTYKALAMK